MSLVTSADIRRVEGSETTAQGAVYVDSAGNVVPKGDPGAAYKYSIAEARRKGFLTTEGAEGGKADPSFLGMTDSSAPDGSDGANCSEGSDMADGADALAVVEVPAVVEAQAEGAPIGAPVAEVAPVAEAAPVAGAKAAKGKAGK